MVELSEHLKGIAKKGGENSWKFLSGEERKARVAKIQAAIQKQRASKKKK